jgi:hypothetical protein
MATIWEAVEKHLVDKMLWPAEARAIVSEVIAKDDTGVRWDEQVSAYPAMLLVVLKLTVNHAAKAWLAQNKPMHFARAMFE